MKSDAELIFEFKNGTPKEKDKVFAELVKRHRERVYWTCRKMLKSHDDADDVAQNVFIKAHRALLNFNEEAQFSTWVYKIATNESINFIRAQKTRDASSIDDMISDPMDDTDRPDESLQRREQRDLIESAIQSLPEKQRAVFVMRYYDELPYEEIADTLGTSVGGLKANYFHAFKKIEEYVKLRAKP
jgi:RNA polymerase sigma factor (sigma-70 family)